jgi:hypothetical protein
MGVTGHAIAERETTTDRARIVAGMIHTPPPQVREEQPNGQSARSQYASGFAVPPVQLLEEQPQWGYVVLLEQ